jgi:hypothetical protein
MQLEKVSYLLITAPNVCLGRLAQGLECQAAHFVPYVCLEPTKPMLPPLDVFPVQRPRIWAAVGLLMLVCVHTVLMELPPFTPTLRL